MKINHQGCTRIVFILKNIVIKIPRFTYSWEHFLKGIIGNIQENKTWKYNSGKWESGNSYLLCPVVFCSWGGWILIMKRADIKKHIEEIRNESQCLDAIETRYSKWVEVGFKGDDKPDNYGYIGDQLVKVDYGS